MFFSTTYLVVQVLHSMKLLLLLQK